MQVTIHSAKTHLSRLIKQACAGEDVVISRGNQPLVRLVPIRPQGQRVFGAMQGMATVDDAFFVPFPDDELEGWNQ